MKKCKLCEKKGIFLSLTDNGLCSQCHEAIACIPADFTVIDLETTGLDPWKHEILEVGAIKFRDGREVDRFHSYVLPKKAIPYEATRVNGITLETVLGAPPISKIQDSFTKFVSDDTIVGFNVQFDKLFIIAHCNAAFANNPTFDVLQLSRKLLPHEQNYKLDYFRKKFKLEGLSHSAIGDCEATIHLLGYFQSYGKSVR